MDVQRSRARRARVTAGVLVMTAGLLAVAAVVGRPYLHRSEVVGPELAWWLLAALFAVAELTNIEIPGTRRAQSFSLSEIPLVLGLFLAAPVQLLVGRLLAVLVVGVVRRRTEPLKTSWNLAMAACETAVAVALFDVLRAGRVAGPLTWLAAGVAAVTASVLALLALTGVIWLHGERSSTRSVLAQMARDLRVVPLAVLVALVAVTSLTAAAVDAWLLAPAGLGVLLAHRAYAALHSRHLDLERLHRFTAAVSAAPETETVLGRVLAEACIVSGSGRAEIAFVRSSGGEVARVRLGAAGQLSHPAGALGPGDDWLLTQVVHDGGPVLMPRGTADPHHRRWLAAHGAHDALAIPLPGESGTLGVLVVSDRTAEAPTYSNGDIPTLRTVAEQAAAALRNAELVDQLRHEALHDPLTGLPNRAHLQRCLATALDDVAGSRSPAAAVLLLDLDGFKAVNDTRGHQQGDRLLVEVGERLVTAVGSAGTVARLGGDEFAVLLGAVPDEDAAVAVGRRVLTALAAPIALDGGAARIGGSLGVALAPAHAADPTALLRCADLAMYEAKAARAGLRVAAPATAPGAVRA